MESKHQGSCHCGAVHYAVNIDLTGASRCNCSVCTKLAIAGVQVKPEAFTLLSDESALADYEWGGKVAKRYFCRTCGTHCFGRGYLEILGGAFVSINVNTLDDVDPYQLPLVHWDGRHNNWQAGARPAPWPIFGPGEGPAAS
jgi:hypothetical protein